jgi:pyruvate formate lyase activating enzyme
MDTNGSMPEVLEELIRCRLLDYIAMDLKAPLNKYATVTRTKINGKTIRRSLDIVAASGLNHEFRTTVVKSQLNEADILAMGNLIGKAPLYALQRYNAAKPLDKNFLSEATYSKEELDAMKGKLEKKIARVIIR